MVQSQLASSNLRRTPFLPANRQSRPLPRCCRRAQAKLACQQGCPEHDDAQVATVHHHHLPVHPLPPVIYCFRDSCCVNSHAWTDVEVELTTDHNAGEGDGGSILKKGHDGFGHGIGRAQPALDRLPPWPSGNQQSLRCWGIRRHRTACGARAAAKGPECPSRRQGEAACPTNEAGLYMPGMLLFAP